MQECPRQKRKCSAAPKCLDTRLNIVFDRSAIHELETDRYENECVVRSRDNDARRAEWFYRRIDAMAGRSYVPSLDREWDCDASAEYSEPDEPECSNHQPMSREYGTDT